LEIIATFRVCEVYEVGCILFTICRTRSRPRSLQNVFRKEMKRLLLLYTYVYCTGTVYNLKSSPLVSSMFSKYV